MSDEKLALFDADRVLRVARALRDEAFYQRYGFMPTAGDGPSAESYLRAARVAVLAADDDREALAVLRAERDRRAQALLRHTEPAV